MNIHKEKTFFILAVAFIIIGGTSALILLPHNDGTSDDLLSSRNDVSQDVSQHANPPVPVVVTSALKKQSSAYLARDGVYVIQYTDTGFVPKTIQITKGKSVRFINMSTKGLRVFTDTVNDPKFVVLNESKTIGKGGTYTFSFDIEGLWAYHNENHASDHANIVVY